MERRFIRIILLLCCIFCSSFLHATVKIGTPVFAPPFAVNVQHYMLEGFDIELMNLICSDLNWQCEFIPVQNNDLFSALNQNQVDFIIGGLTITPERQLLYLFSQPYLPSEGGFIVPNQSAIYTISDLQNKRIATLRGRVYGPFLAQNSPVPIKIVTYAIYDDLMLAVKNGEADAAFINYYTALYIEHRYPDLARVLHRPFDLGYGIGIATSFNNADKIEQINQMLTKYESNGVYVRLYNYYFQFFAK
ncbi:MULTISPECIES: transporter substrate-binding domain-containing protein [Legionella]|uniref:Arginine ABC transporter substrate-binding protein n=1 Tax=Legionella maceachernii TaxID=466 RepID=A0A0W0W3Y3_9GAMM|nr:transporter substrate-binding domain-containing protein [Legionella maceachernii]KTD27009.1 arginine ABC transporter substrate-binding protein [Legionella maceachernii]SKA03089.1 arginine transport system substrate-binding protein [Legionella maceachernii]SUP00150.1 Putative ABC transporter arginine-binding protein 2 precursor [Legionella maceachernii]